jgi:hypothetical protein
MTDTCTAQPIDTAPKDGGWILAHVPENGEPPFNQPWVILTWGDEGWYDEDGNGHDPIAWAPLPDPQPKPTGWTPPAGTIQIAEVRGSWIDGKSVDIPWRWVIGIEKPDGTSDKHRGCDVAVTLEEAKVRAERWQAKIGLPVEIVPLDGKVIPFRLAVTKQ